MTDESSPPVAASRMFQVYEQDLEELERILPDLCSRLYSQLGKEAPGATKLRTQLRKCKEIISDIRWNYGPPLDVVTEAKP